MEVMTQKTENRDAFSYWGGNMSKKVIVAGHICIDITPVFQGKSVTNVSDILKPGKLIQMGKAEVSTGGVVANTGLGMKILGADVTLMGKIGNDEFGNLILGILDKYDALSGLKPLDELRAKIACGWEKYGEGEKL